MRFLFIAPRYHVNTHYMVKALQIKGHQVGLLAMYRGQAEDYSALNPEILGYAWCFRLINRWFFGRPEVLMKSDFEMRYSHPDPLRLFIKIKKFNPDVLVIKNIQSAFSILSLIIAKILRKKIIILLQLPKYRARNKSQSVALVGKLFGAKVVTPVLGDRRYHNKNENLFYLPFTIDAEDFDKKYFAKEKINILCLAKYQERKGQLLLLQAVKNLLVQYPGLLQVDFFGEKDEADYLVKLEKYIKDNALINTVKINFTKSHSEIKEICRQHDLFVLPSWSEAAAFSILEAMSAQLPVICSDGNGTKCYIDDGVNGYIFKQRDALDLQEKINSIIKSRENINAMGSTSFRFAQERHSLEKFYQAFIKLVA